MKSFIEEDQMEDIVAMIETETNAYVVSNTSEADMDMILDSKFYDINMQEFLDDEQVIDFADDGDSDREKLHAEMEVFLRPAFLGSSSYSTAELFRRKRVRFERLKKKMRKLFCQIIAKLPDLRPEEWNLKTIIKKVVEATIAFFKIGFPALLTAFVVNLLVKVVKGGIARVCPV